MADTLHRIIRIAGDICRAGLQCTEQREEDPCGPGQQQDHTVPPADTAGDQCICHAIRIFIQLPVSELSVRRKDRPLIRSLLCPAFYTGMEQPVCRDIRLLFSLPEALQHMVPFLIQEIDAPYPVPACHRKLLQYDGVGPKELADQLLGVNRIAVLHLDGRSTLPIYDPDGKPELGVRDLHTVSPG